MKKQSYFKYWGKARQREDGGWDCHLLPYHCFDVAVVGKLWLEQDDALRARIAYAIGMEKKHSQMIRIIEFFLALHDLGKYDIRFQSKRPELRNHLWGDLDKKELFLSPKNIIEFDHGKAGFVLFLKFFPQLFNLKFRDEDLLDKWRPWIAAVTGHHGVMPRHADWHNPSVAESIMVHDQQARSEWFTELTDIFWGKGENKFIIPEVSRISSEFIAGLCSVADWIASNDLSVRWICDEIPLKQYYEESREYYREKDIFRKLGILGCPSARYVGIESLLSGNKPRQLQTLIDSLLPESGLLVIEGPTGSGKTEAALAYAWKLIDSNQADSIIFALPTQATADAMLDRLQNLTPFLFRGGNANLVLAHGKARYNTLFANLKAAGRPDAVQNGNQGAVQCAEWISSSRKRVFLGQIGVCTIDQVLLSVLPVRHNFVRSFGLMRSVLIVDEVHAYDRYMYGLLEEVLKRQKTAGGSAILLSATLPAVQKQELYEAWGKSGSVMAEDTPYPLISKITATGGIQVIPVPIQERPEERVVGIELISSEDMMPEESVISNLIEAAGSGALAAVVCNLVQDAQKVARQLQKRSANIPIDIFHGRFRFKDRQEKENTVKEKYGKVARRDQGRIIVATQVVEQSLDLDFDILVTQLCPIDLLFQRMGRLHRHQRLRPIGFEEPRTVVLTNSGDDFGIHKHVYPDVRVLWRTRELLKKQRGKINFPEAYRTLIESVYSKAVWEDNEPDSVIGESIAFRQDQDYLRVIAQRRANEDINPFVDIDQIVASLTRGSEMSLNVIPLRGEECNKVLLDGECLVDVDEFTRDELLSLNAIAVPSSWKKWLPESEDGYIYLSMSFDNGRRIWKKGGLFLIYTRDFGLELWEE